MFIIAASVCIILALLYAVLMAYFGIGWRSLKNFPSAASWQAVNSFSIIIPARNEEGSIIDCLNDIINQEFDTRNFEIIVMDDFSEDSTSEKVETFIIGHPGFKIRLIKMAELKTGENNSFKKQAIATGINQSKFDWIITSDADCRHGAKWLSAIDAFICGNNAVLISAPVAFDIRNNFFQKVQALEFSGLVGIGAASIYQKSPNMCNGANLIYRKDAFYEVEGFSGYDDIASGDDEFLMHKIYTRWPDGIFFLKNRDAIAYTRPAENLDVFIQQRKRWVSKSRKYARKSITTILIGAYLFHLLLLSCFVATCFQWTYIIIFAAGFMIKVLGEFFLLTGITRFFRQSHILPLLVPAAYLYIYYVLIIGIYGNFGKYEWKGRRVK